MKPSNFRYLVPSTLQAALEMRAEAEDSVVLAGGQSLIPTMNFRLSNPDVVIDLRKLEELDYVTVSANTVRVGAMTRQRVLERNAQVSAANPLIRETLQNVAHPVIEGPLVEAWRTRIRRPSFRLCSPQCGGS
jgi:carbon-monoxide dehydrogenase medium subunit